MHWESNPCKLWPGPPDKDGYGRKWRDGKTRKAHRLAYEDAYGPIASGLQVQHLCDVKYPAADFTYRRCVEPTHLTVGWPATNSAHMAEARRAALGLRNARYTHPETTARGSRHVSYTKPDRVPRGERNGRYTKPERTARGERHGSAVLTESQVRSIRQLWHEGIGVPVLAKQFRVSRSTVNDIIKRRSWKHIT